MTIPFFPGIPFRWYLASPLFILWLPLTVIYLFFRLLFNAPKLISRELA